MLGAIVLRATRSERRQKMKNCWQFRFVYFTTMALWACSATAQSDDEEELALAYGDKSTVSIATGSVQPITRAPSVATVITAQDMQAMGATDLDEILETVPGLHVSRNNIGYAPIYNIRGINSQFNPQVLVLLNGARMNSVFLGDRGLVWGGYPLENIARIEVIRGPGSALYGADAYAGVINIVTKSAAEIGGTEAGARAGSFNTRDAWVLHGGKWGEVDVAAYLRAGKTDGHKEIVAADAQTGLDTLFGTRASLATGPVALGRDAADGHFGLSWKKWHFHAEYKVRKNVQTGAGLSQALDPEGTSSNKRLMADLSYRTTDWFKDWDISLQAGYFHMEETTYALLFPPGAFGGAFPMGMVGAPEKRERHLNFGASAFYSGLRNHRVRIGVGRNMDELYRLGERKNFNFVYILGTGNVPAPTGIVQYATNDTIYLKPHSRSVRYLYVQDEWNFIKDWYLTTGLRHDRYSDFGSTTNPRLAIVWEAAYNLTAKLLAGKAFRAPSFTELYNINNPVNIGNPALRPETIKTTELALAWQPISSLQTGFNLFHYQMSDIIRLVPNTDPTTGSAARNTGGQVGRGLELDVAWDVSRNFRLSGNYAHQRSINQMTDSDAGYAPYHQFYARIDWRVAPDWRLNGQINRVADRRREAGDSRPPVPDYHTVDLTARYGGGKSNKWEVAVSVRNLFNAKVREPSLAPGLIPNDLPMARRAVYLQASYRM